MKVYFITGGYDGCYYVRCLLPIVSNGWWGAKTSLRMIPESTDRQFQGAMAADVVVFQRPMQKEMLEAAKLLKQRGKKIVFDNDDTYRKDSGIPTWMKPALEAQVDKRIDEINTNLSEFVSIADLVTTTTRYLADEYRALNTRVKVLPNMVDPNDWPKPKRNKGKKVRIGVVGSVASNQDYTPAKEALVELSKRDDVQLVLFALPRKTKETEFVRSFYAKEFEFWDTLNVEWQPFVGQEDYADTLNNLELDIMLIPRADNYFNRCKSNVKFLEAAMLEIPVIAQGFPDGKSPYQVNPDDANHLIIAENNWLSETLRLVFDKKLRRELGKAARKYVLQNYNIHKTGKLWKEAYQELLNADK